MPPSWTATAITCAMNPDDAVSGPSPVWSTHGASRPWIRSDANVPASQSRPETSRLPPNSATPRRPSRRIALPPNARPLADQSSVPSSPNARSAFGMNPSSSVRHASPSPGACRSNSAAFASALRSRNAASPSGNAVAVGSSVFRYSRPRAASSSPSRACAAPPTQSGCHAENTSWWKPGSVTSAVRMQPPSQSLRSRTTTCQPARASSAPQASELTPLPTRTTSASEAFSGDFDVGACPLQQRGERTALVGPLDRGREGGVVEVGHVGADGQLGADDLVALPLDLVHHDPAAHLEPARRALEAGQLARERHREAAAVRRREQLLRAGLALGVGDPRRQRERQPGEGAAVRRRERSGAA